MKTKLTILGGGIAGIATAYYARQKNYTFDLYEAENRIGGNCYTSVSGEFSWDSGAHRFHDQDPEITRDVQSLMGDALMEIHAPSKIYYRNKLISFPIHPFNLFRQLGFLEFTRALSAFIYGRLLKNKNPEHFQSFANSKYGPYIAKKFLLNYSEKLWGISTDQLSTTIAGKRLRGMSLINILAESLLNRQFVTEHVEGHFFYPKSGIGSICHRMAEKAGREHIHLKSPVIRIIHNHNRILRIVLNNQKSEPVNHLISTLPISVLIQSLNPAPPQVVIDSLKQIRYRHILLVILTINRPSVTPYATLYFPETEIPFTRIYEPKNRSRSMAPPHQTQIVAEVPCFGNDAIWIQPDEAIHRIRNAVISTGIIKEEEIIQTRVQKLAYSYPILSLESEGPIRQIHAYLSTFSNLHISGRSGRFIYAWIHDMLRFGKEIVAEIKT